MCGIAGILQRRGTVELGALERMAEGLRHRGPDDRGIERIDAVGLAHTRLSIIDLAGGHQPLMTPERDLSLVANGEIYNYVELREALEREHGVRFATGSDSETILHAYAVHGLAALEHLHGMFAFALYDRRRGRLILARDRLGIKPLYYAVAGDRLAFASEIKALLPALPRSPALAPGAVMQFLQSQFSAGADTALEGVHRVLPGEAIVVDSELNLEHHRYWSPLDVQPSPMSEAQATEAFDGLFDRVMREHVRSDVPYGAFLSGGVDSGTLVGCLTRFQEGPVRTFSVGYAGADERGELAEAERIARRFGTRHRPLRLDRERIFRRIPHMIWSADELMRDYACLPTALLAEAAGRELKVVFTGEGGDEMFAGYGRYRPARATALL
ncbi:MAG: asparagine synthase (glutamine-hydrolyzing), partial [Gammaproteobacteria bacterium]|nr:asparagine synthase (glutamine-hydrolyzing) [Gammaproteobacteria bacterium]